MTELGTANPAAAALETGTPLVLRQHFSGKLDARDPAMVTWLQDLKPLPVRSSQRITTMQKTFFLAAFGVAALLTAPANSAPATPRGPLNAHTLDTIKSQFSRVMDLANKHDLKALHEMFWKSPSALLVAKSAIPSEGNWAGYWGNDAIDQKLSDIARSGPVVLTPDFTRLKVVGLTHDMAQSYAPMTITVSYAGQDGTPKPFLMIIEWIKVKKDWKIASEIILPVPPAPSAKG